MKLHLKNSDPMVIIVTVYAVLCVLLWLPTGWQTGLTGDAWYFFMSAENQFFSISRVRPLVQLIFNSTHLLFGESVVGFNIVLAVMLFSRSLLTYKLLRQLRAVPMLAFAIGALVLLLPIDSGVFYMGANAVYLSGTLSLAAVLLLIAYWRRPRPLTLFLMGTCMVIAVGIYEASLPVLMVAPLVLVWLGGRWTPRLRHVLLRWYLVPVVWVFYLIATYLTTPEAFSYQRSISAGIDLGHIALSFASLYARHVLFTWTSFGARAFSTPLFGLSLLAAVIVVASLLFIHRLGSTREQGGAATSPSLMPSSVVVIAMGLLLIGLAVSAYTPTSLIDVTLRTYWVSSVGAALILGGALWLLKPTASRTRLALVSLALGGIVTLGTYETLEQHVGYTETSEAQQAVVKQFAAVIPGVIANTNMLVLDRTEDAAMLNQMDGYWNFPYPFYVAYGVTREHFFTLSGCGLDTTFAVGDVPASLPSSYCLFAPDHYEVWTLGTRTVLSNYSDLLVVAYTARDSFQIVADLAPYLGQGQSPANYRPAARLLPDAARVTERMARLFQ